MKRIIFINLIFFMAFTQVNAEKMRLAVLDFKSDGVPEKTSARVSELVRTEMINAGNFTIIERKEIDTILKEQGFQQSGCTETSCAVKIGAMLSAKKILIGTVMALGNSIVINGRIIDVEKGTAEYGEKQDAKDENDLYKAVSIFAKNLSDRIKGEYKENSGTYSTSKDKAYNSSSEYHSPALAGVWSIIPFWSGSWNKGFDGFESWGMPLVIAKGLSFGCVLTFKLMSLEYKDRAEKDESAAAYIIINQEAYEEKLSQAEDNRELSDKYNKYAKYSVIPWIGFTIVDIIYSVITINDFNKEHRQAFNKKISQEVYFSLEPHIYNEKFINAKGMELEGFDVVISYKF